jgi:hypothetical protein
MCAEFARKLWSNQKLSNSRGSPRIRPHALAISASVSGVTVEMKHFWGSVTSELGLKLVSGVEFAESPLYPLNGR